MKSGSPLHTSNSRSPDGLSSHISQLETPAILIDGPTFEHNLAAAEQMMKGTGKWLRPHFKSHELPGIALRQMGPHTSGLTCSTVEEVEVAVAAGFDSVLLANEIVTPDKIERVVSLADRSQIIMAVDAAEPLGLISEAATQQGVVVDAVVDLDIGLGRCGVATPTKAADLAAAIDRAPGVRFAGIMGYEGRFRSSMDNRSDSADSAFALITEARDLVEAMGLEVGMVSTSGTSTLLEAIQVPSITEIQAGTYVFMEPDIDDLGLPFRCALSVLVTVVSRKPGKVIVDGGRRTIFGDFRHPVPLDTRARDAQSHRRPHDLKLGGQPPSTGHPASIEAHLQPDDIPAEPRGMAGRSGWHGHALPQHSRGAGA